MKQDYSDIIALPHHRSVKHPPMTVEMRAAQFSPYAALVGYDGVIKETGRLTDDAPVDSETRIDDVNARLQVLQAVISSKPVVSVTYFQSDSLKAGGSYLTEVKTVQRILTDEGQLMFSDGQSVPFEHIVALESPLFEMLGG